MLAHWAKYPIGFLFDDVADRVFMVTCGPIIEVFDFYIQHPRMRTAFVAHRSWAGLQIPFLSCRPILQLTYAFHRKYGLRDGFSFAIVDVRNSSQHRVFILEYAVLRYTSYRSSTHWLLRIFMSALNCFNADWRPVAFAMFTSFVFSVCLLHPPCIGNGMYSSHQVVPFSSL